MLIGYNSLKDNLSIQRVTKLVICYFVKIMFRIIFRRPSMSKDTQVYIHLCTNSLVRVFSVDMIMRRIPAYMYMFRVFDRIFNAFDSGRFGYHVGMCRCRFLFVFRFVSMDGFFCLICRVCLLSKRQARKVQQPAYCILA